MNDKIVLLDGNSIMNRAFYGIPILTNSQGVYTNAVYGFLNIMLKIMDEESPRYMVVAFDVKKPTFRHERYAEYKGTRKGMPEELKVQMPIIKDVLKAMNITILEKAGYEADDILGTIARNSEELGLDVSLVSGDRDLLQIATDKIRIRIPKTKKSGTEIEDYYTDDVYEKYGVSPIQIIDLKGLMGDAADNIPGVPGIGEKTATKIIKEFGSVENAIANIDKVMPNKARENLRENTQKAILSKELATIKTDCELDYSLEESLVENMFNEEAVKFFKKLEFKNLLSRIQCADALKNELELDVRYITDLAEFESICNRMIELHKDSLKDGVSSLRNSVENITGIGIKVAATSEGRKIYLSYEEGKVVCVKEEGFLTYDYIIDKIRYLLSQNVMLIFNDVKSQLKFFDMSESGYIVDSINTDYIWDVALAEYLVKPLSDTYSYDDLGKDYAGVLLPSLKELLGKDKKQSQEEVDEKYNQSYIYDAYINYKVFANATKELAESNMINLMLDIELPLTYTLYDMEKRGIKAKEEELKDYGTRLKKRIEDLELLIYDMAGESFNINSPKQLGIILFEKMNMPFAKKTKTGYSTSADVLEKLRSEHEIINYILEYRQLTKLKSTYADGLTNYIEEDKRIRSTFNQMITATGRISSTEPNLQNIPVRLPIGREIRKVFVPQEDCVFVDADYSQIELRVLAHMSGDEKLIAAYKSDQDIHRITASEVFNIPLEEVTDLQRRNAKAVNFGIVYGISSFGLGQDLNITRKEADTYIKSYFATYPDGKKYLDGLVENAKKDGYITTLYNRRRPIPELSSSNFMQRSFGERVAMNSPIQGTAADIIKIAMIKVNETLRIEKLKSRLLLQIHDELLIETHISEVEKVKEILSEQMHKAASLLVPLEIDMNVGDTWYDVK